LCVSLSTPFSRARFGLLEEEVVAAQLLFLVELRVGLVNARAEVGRVAAEGDVQILQELVAASEKRLGLVSMSVDTRLAIKDDNAIGEVRGHDKIVLDDESSLLGVHDESLDDATCNDTLLGVEIGRRLVNDVNIGRHTESQDNGNLLRR